jgi:hypothetical protein
MPCDKARRVILHNARMGRELVGPSMLYVLSDRMSHVNFRVDDF